jgi:DNA-binding NarL/FixJ family response regulator
LQTSRFFHPLKLTVHSQPVICGTPPSTAGTVEKINMAITSSKARIMVVDDHPMVRDGLIRLITQQDDLVCCGQAGTVAETLATISKKQPDLLILDLRLKGGDGLELIKTLMAQYPQLRILILSQYEAPLYVERALRAGALGYVVKEQAAEEVLKAIRAVLAGEIYLTRGMAARFLRRFVGPGANKEDSSGAEPLSDRELHVLQLLGSGLSTREIAAELKLSFKTIESHRENIKRKLGLRNASALVHYATDWCREQLSLPPPSPPPG